MGHHKAIAVLALSSILFSEPYYTITLPHTNNDLPLYLQLALLPLWPTKAVTDTPNTGVSGEGKGDKNDKKEAQEGYSSIVWSVPVSEAARLKGLDKDAFLTELNTALQVREWYE